MALPSIRVNQLLEVGLRRIHNQTIHLQQTRQHPASSAAGGANTRTFETSLNLHRPRVRLGTPLNTSSSLVSTQQQVSAASVLHHKAAAYHSISTIPAARAFFCGFAVDPRFGVVGADPGRRLRGAGAPDTDRRRTLRPPPPAAARAAELAAAGSGGGLGDAARAACGAGACGAGVSSRHDVMPLTADENSASAGSAPPSARAQELTLRPPCITTRDEQHDLRPTCRHANTLCQRGGPALHLREKCSELVDACLGVTEHHTSELAELNTPRPTVCVQHRRTCLRFARRVSFSKSMGSSASIARSLRTRSTGCGRLSASTSPAWVAGALVALNAASRRLDAKSSSCDTCANSAPTSVNGSVAMVD